MPHALTSRVVRLANRTRLVFRLYSTLKRLLTQMGNGFLLKSHNGAHCCGTVGDSHSHSQLSTAKCTFTGNSSMELRYKGNTFFRTTCIIGDFFVNLQTNGMHRPWNIIIIFVIWNQPKPVNASSVRCCCPMQVWRKSLHEFAQHLFKE